VRQRTSTFHSKVLCVTDGDNGHYCGVYVFDEKNLIEKGEYAYGNDICFGVWTPIGSVGFEGTWDVYSVSPNASEVDPVNTLSISPEPVYSWRSASYRVESRPWYLDAVCIAGCRPPSKSRLYRDPVTEDMIESYLAKLVDHGDVFVVILGAFHPHP